MNLRKKTILKIAAVLLAFSFSEPLHAQVEFKEKKITEQNVYVADEGDTLWDICELFFDDPWYWPVLWSFNPHITNPHWIFPGDVVYLTPPKEPPPVGPLLKLTESRFSVGAQEEAILARKVGFISEDEYADAGIIKNSREDKLLLGENDEAYIKFSTKKKVKPGDLFIPFRILGKVKHPVTGKKIGYKIQYLGVAKVLSTEKPQTKALILKSYEEIERDLKVVHYFPSSVMVKPIKNAGHAKGVIVDRFGELSSLGEYSYVVIDQGKKQGVSEGNRFVVKQKGDGLEKFNPKKLDDFPDEIVGEILVIEPYENMSLGVLTYAIKELVIGETVEMVAGY